jgi:hypothetical protein
MYHGLEIEQDFVLFLLGSLSSVLIFVALLVFFDLRLDLVYHLPDVVVYLFHNDLKPLVGRTVLILKRFVLFDLFVEICLL